MQCMSALNPKSQEKTKHWTAALILNKLCCDPIKKTNAR